MELVSRLLASMLFTSWLVVSFKQLIFWVWLLYYFWFTHQALLNERIWENLREYKFLLTVTLMTSSFGTQWSTQNSNPWFMKLKLSEKCIQMKNCFEQNYVHRLTIWAAVEQKTTACDELYNLCDVTYKTKLWNIFVH